MMIENISVILAPEAVGRTHGNLDAVLPIQASQYIVEQLRSAGYEVDYREFDGPHAVSLSLAKASWDWMIQGTAEAHGQVRAEFPANHLN
jgi:predicted esterase